ncbi:hypothetical protein BJ508DRAFT_325100 [Ascobolus immersus RN42]|uniref:Uncharacterized protein n=1 Tax=Ascobolus immersus RN42 TaxID=1160509 RepID=A0A3N4IFH9_ASCIM|nr:hypothetical protein BJ508DRAFT_325100 [Ascobolus immersus RN42]
MPIHITSHTVTSSKVDKVCDVIPSDEFCTTSSPVGQPLPAGYVRSINWALDQQCTCTDLRCTSSGIYHQQYRNWCNLFVRDPDFLRTIGIWESNDDGDRLVAPGQVPLSKWIIPVPASQADSEARILARLDVVCLSPPERKVLPLNEFNNHRYYLIERWVSGLLDKVLDYITLLVNEALAKHPWLSTFRTISLMRRLEKGRKRRLKYERALEKLERTDGSGSDNSVDSSGEYTRAPPSTSVRDALGVILESLGMTYDDFELLEGRYSTDNEDQWPGGCGIHQGYVLLDEEDWLEVCRQQVDLHRSSSRNYFSPPQSPIVVTRLIQAFWDKQDGEKKCKEVDKWHCTAYALRDIDTRCIRINPTVCAAGEAFHGIAVLPVTKWHIRGAAVFEIRGLLWGIYGHSQY